MKHILHKHLCPRGTTVMLSALLLLAAASAAYAGQVTVTRTYDTSAITLGTETAPDGTQFQSIGWPGLDCNAETGAPQLPVEYIRLMVPVYSNNFRVTLQSATGAYQLPLQSKVIAGQIPQATDGSPAPEFTYPDGEAYTAAGANARVVSHGYIDGCNHLVTVAVCPVAYDGATGATAYGSVTVRLDYDECTEAGLEGSRPLFPPHASPYVDVAGMVANTPDVARFRAARLPDATKGEYADWYYIIVPENLEQAVADLALWKRQKGYNVVVKTIESIVATPKYAVGALNPVYGVNPTDTIVDSAESLRIYLKDEYESHGAFFCLLVGDWRTSMPIRKVLASPIHYDGKSTNSEYLIPTDNYFSDLTSDYKLSKKHECGISTISLSNTYHPSIYVGRLLCSTWEEIQNYTDKILLYESNPGKGDNEYLSKAFFFEQHDVAQDENGVLLLDDDGSEKWGSTLINNSWPIRRKIQTFLDTLLYQDQRYIDKDARFPSGSEVVREIGKHGFSSWHGHGSGYSVGATFRYHYVFSSHDINSRLIGGYIVPEESNTMEDLKNKDYPGVVYSISCVNAPFDDVFIYGIHHTELNLASKYTTSRTGGGVAFLGNTREGWFFKCEKQYLYKKYTGPSTELEGLFIDAIQLNQKTGVAETNSKANFNAFGYLDNFVLAEHHLIGEPEFEMWLGKPKYLDWNSLKAYSTEWFPKTEAIGSTWTIWDGENNCFSYKCHGRTPIVTPELLSNDHLISVWKPGYLPLVHYNGINSSINGKSKKFIVRSATLGKSIDGSSSSKFSVGNEGRLSVRALDSITASEKFEVESGGSVNLDCDQKVELTGSTVRSGGKMSVEAENVTLGPGFRVEAGGTLKITTK